MTEQCDDGLQNLRTSRRVPELPERRNEDSISKNADKEPAKSRCSKQAKKTAVRQMAIRAQIDERKAANWRRTRPQENTEPAGAEVENATKTEMRSCTERHAAKIREVETRRCRTVQAVEVWHPRTDLAGKKLMR